jgi:hypothetical protein
MFSNVGMSGSPNAQKLPPQPGQPTTHQLGPFRSVLGPTMSTSLKGVVPAELFVGLLYRAPNLDGVDWIEVSERGYGRQRIAMTQGGSMYLVNANPVKFAWGEFVSGVTHVGLFTAEGELAFYGPMIGVGLGHAAPNEFEFVASSLRCKAQNVKLAIPEPA